MDIVLSIFMGGLLLLLFGFCSTVVIDMLFGIERDKILNSIPVQCVSIFVTVIILPIIFVLVLVTLLFTSMIKK